MILLVFNQRQWSNLSHINSEISVTGNEVSVVGATFPTHQEVAG